MRIDSGTIGMDSARTYDSTEFMVTRFSVGRSKDALGDSFFSDLMNAGKDGENAPGENSDVSIDELRERISSSPIRSIKQSSYDLNDTINRLREECINLILRLLFPDIVEHYSKSESLGFLNSEGVDSGGDQGRISAQGFSYERMYYYEENECTTFNARGTVNCADGRQIDINIDLNMSRSFAEFYAEEIHFVESAFTDPLVINFDGPSSAVSDQTFYFDIDCDGVEDEISRLIEGSGFLALDLDEDGIINDGSELFGACSSDGFRDLAAYDSDNDGWIDEDDEVFEKLRIWAMDERGQMQLYSLSDKGIGAISVSSAPTGFYLNSANDNSTNARVRSTGVFLYEDGNVGTVQQLDFAKRQRAMLAYA